MAGGKELPEANQALPPHGNAEHNPAKPFLKPPLLLADL